MASLDVPGIRPAIFGSDMRDGLDELRKFRHFFRPAYALDLRADKLDALLAGFTPTHAGIERDLEAFAGFVTATIAQLEALSR